MLANVAQLHDGIEVCRSNRGPATKSTIPLGGFFAGFSYRHTEFLHRSPELVDPLKWQAEILPQRISENSQNTGSKITILTRFPSWS